MKNLWHNVKACMLLFIIVIAILPVLNIPLVFATETVLDEFDESTYSHDAYIREVHPSVSSVSSRGQTFQLDENANVSKVSFYMKKVGAPTGNCYAAIHYATRNLPISYSSSSYSGTVYGTLDNLQLITSNTIDLSTLNNETYQWVNFTFSTGNLQLSKGITYAVLCFIGDGSSVDNENYINLAYDGSGGTHEGNLVYHYLGEWSDTNAISTSDLCFKVYGNSNTNLYGVTRNVFANSDDCYIRQDNTFSTTSYCYVGDYSSSIYDYESGLRFQYVTIPSGATITRTALVVRTRNLVGSGVNYIALYGGNVTDSGTFSSSADYRSRVVTSQFVNYTVSSIGGWNSSESYAALTGFEDVVQEMVNDSNWNFGGDMVFYLLDPNGYYNNARTEFYVFNSWNNFEPMLIIEYSYSSSLPEDTDHLITVSEQANLWGFNENGENNVIVDGVSQENNTLLHIFNTTTTDPVATPTGGSQTNSHLMYAWSNAQLWAFADSGFVYGSGEDEGSVVTVTDSVFETYGSNSSSVGSPTGDIQDCDTLFYVWGHSLLFGFVEASSDVTYNSGTTEQTTNTNEGLLGVWGNDQPGYWLEGWDYRKSHIITNASGAGYDYQVKIVVHYGDDSDGGQNVYLDGKCRQDFGDIRFTDNDGESLLDYWMEDLNTGENATFWIKVQDWLDTINRTIYVYYGNSYATSISSAEDTFLLYYNFESSSEINDFAEEYYVGTGSATIDHFDTSYDASEGNPAGSMKLDAEGDSVTGLLHCVLTQDKFKGLSQLAIDVDYRAASNSSATTNALVYILKNETLQASSSLWLSSLINGGTTDSGWNSSTLYTTGIENETVVKIGFGGYDLWSDDNEHLRWFDNIRVRKYVDPEPGHGDWGEEETSPEEPDPIAFVIWGTTWYPVEYFNSGETSLSESVCESIYDSVYDSQQYSYVKNYWGNETTPNNVYGNITYCEENFNCTAFFYKGHVVFGSNGTYAFNSSCTIENCPYPHKGVMGCDNETYNYIMDWCVYDALEAAGSETHDFVFIWACGHGNDAYVGEIDEDGHSWGVMASFMGPIYESMNNTGYNDPDGTNHVFISFYNISISFTHVTEWDAFNYGHWASLFFDYAMLDGWTINDALDAASAITHNTSITNYDDCPLDDGYTEYLAGVPYESWMVIWGDGNYTLANWGDD